MTPSEYAQELVDKQPDVMSLTLRRLSAHVAATEIFEVVTGFAYFGTTWRNPQTNQEDDYEAASAYYQQVIQEINNAK